MKRRITFAIIPPLLAVTAQANACPPNHMRDMIQETATVRIGSLDEKYNLFMSLDKPSDKIFVVAEDRKTCRINSDFMEEDVVLRRYGVSFSEVWEVQNSVEE